MSAKSTKEELEAAFALFDKDGNGTISFNEFKAAMKKSDPSLSKEQIEGMLKQADIDGSKSLSFEEFSKVMTSDQNEEELKAAFDAFDADRSGFITKDELRKAMQNCGASVGDKELDEMIASADANSDGKVNFEEFKKMMGAV